MITEQETGPETSTELGRHATNLELFLDLVFVFAVTQVASVLGSDLTLEGVVRGLLLGWLVWWLWSQFTWLGTAIDLSDRSGAKFQVLATIPLIMLMAVAIPSAFGASGLQFAGAYLAVALWTLAIQGWSLWRDPVTRAPWLRFVPLAALAPGVLFAGAFFEDGIRMLVWGAVAVFNVASAIAAGSRGRDSGSEWAINAVHFAERHSLFVIISLGEILVAVGTSATGPELTLAGGVTLVAAVAVACALWWTYFAYVPRVVEHALQSATGRQRGDVARRLFTFGHFPIVFGLVLFAVAAKHAVGHPTESLGAGDLIVLAGAVMVFLGGLLRLQWQIVRRVAPERVAAIGTVAALCWLAGPLIPGGLLLAAVAVIIAVMHGISVRRFDRRTAA